MYAKIMVAVDGSPIAMHALDEAMLLAKIHGAELMSVYVVEYPHTYISDLGYDPLPITEALVSEGRHVLEKAECLMKSRQIDSKSLLVDNRPTLDSIAEQLQKVADEYAADLVILGTHGRGGFKRLLLGSVAQDFVRITCRPVLLIPGKHHKEERTEQREEGEPYRHTAPP
ncbi:universal stress protein [Pollutimonas bauzanensis]|jgi:nucleotide-binding universal stress UspA family protein|uniref:universal stress protein n=1 Tax=Pollutimonas bauzanensis TaxID=658167 RepID=UPI0033414684